MIYYAVIDTNVVISAMLKPESNPGMVLKYALSGVIVLLVNDEILNEYITVTNRKEFAFEKEDINSVISAFQEKAVILERTTTTESFLDKKDVVFYEIVQTGRTLSDAYLITGNKKHFPSKPFVVNPREMLDIIENDMIAECRSVLAGKDKI